MAQETQTEEQLLPIQGEHLAALFYLALLGWFGYIVWVARTYDPADRLFLYIVLPPTVLLTVYQLIKIFLPGAHQKITDKFMIGLVRINPFDSSSSEGKSKEELQAKMANAMDSDRPDKIRQTYELQTAASVVLLGVLVYLIGFIYALPLYVFAFVLYYDQSVRSALVVTVGFSLLMYVLFLELLNVVLWDGAIDLAIPFL